MNEIKEKRLMKRKASDLLHFIKCLIYRRNALTSRKCTQGEPDKGISRDALLLNKHTFEDSFGKLLLKRICFLYI